MIKNSIENIRPNEDRLDGIYRGVIEDNNDPEKAGRCRIRIFGVHTDNKIKTELDGIPTDELPWAEPALSLFEGSVSGFGSWTVPLQGSHVFLFFENGHILQPRYFASAPGIPTESPDKKSGFNDPDGNYPVSEVNAPHEPNGLNEPDFHKLGRSEGLDSTIVQSKTDNKRSGISTADGGSWDEPDPYYSAEYPNNKVFASNSGIVVEIDDTNGEERIHIYHPSNSYIEINKDGDMIIRNAGDRFDIVDGNRKTFDTNSDSTTNSNKTDKIGSNKTEDVGSDRSISVGGNETKEVTGNKDDTISGAATKDVTNNDEETVGGIKSVTATGEIKLISSTKITLQAPAVSVV